MSADHLRQDVHRHLISASMPGYVGPGRGREAGWTHMAVSRAAYLARLRARDVNGHVLPLLAFIRDGWGWRWVRDDVAEAIRRQAAVERRELNRPSKVKHQHDLFDNVDQTQPADLSVPRDAVRGARHWVASVLWFGSSLDSTAEEYQIGLAALLDTAVGYQPNGEELERRRQLVRRLHERRNELALTPGDVADWLSGIDEELVLRGWQLLRQLLWSVRRVQRPPYGQGQRTTNPLTFFGTSVPELIAQLRRETGRPTAAHLLGEVIGSAMFLAAVTEGIEEFNIG